MKWDDFKNKFRKDVQQQNVDVDVDSIWNAIESDVDVINKKKKRRFFFWLFFVGIGLISGLSIYLLSNESVVVVEKNIPTKTILKPKSTPQSADNQPIKELSKVEGSNTSTLIVKEENINTELNKFKLNHKSNSNFNDKKVNGKSFRGIDKAESKNKNANSAITKTEWIQTPITENKLSNEGNKIDFNTTSSVDEVANSKTETVEQKVQLEIFKLPSAFLLLDILNTETTLDISQSYTSVIYKKELEEELKLNEEEGNNKPSKSRFNFSTEVYGGINFVNRKIEAKDPSSNDLLNIRKDNESPLEACYLGLHLNLKTKKGIYLTSGIQRTVIAERYVFNNTIMTMDSVMGVKTLLVNLTGDTISKMGMLPRTTTSIFDKKIFNTYTLIDIPIYVGYESVKNKWALGIEAGVLANISLKTKGIIPNELFDDVNIETQQDEIFKSKVGLSYHLGLTASRKIIKNKNWWLTIAPSLRILPSDFTNDNYSLSQKYTLFGARVGVRYGF